ncbi:MULTISPECIES: hypothetical protein [Sphingobacterium]|uniref:Lasso RiPP family leader peptide-containing protein n=1 Tax=Sphingobacterium hotanense TaxID=649196 RepID=A0ABT7NKW6_9SPHI|nr:MULTISPECIES: hypothetical protein [Sphingobacterium]MDM1047791.1 hypothetical protein [Sphingobacterium hotanense]
MKKTNYQTPRINLEVIELECGIAAESTGTVTVGPPGIEEPPEEEVIIEI